MREDLDKVIAVLKYWGLQPDINIYAWRFFIQKLTLLLKLLDIGINYDFTIHVKGPYSHNLAYDYYKYRDRVALLKTPYKPTQDDIKTITKIRNIVFKGIKSPSDINGNLQHLESLSTIVYLMIVNPNITDNEVFVKIKQIKSYLSDSQIVIGRSVAKELLFKPEYLTDKLRKEIAEWDKIEDRGGF